MIETQFDDLAPQLRDCADAEGLADDHARDIASEPAEGVRFGLDSLMLVTALVAVCLGVGRVAPAFGVMLAMLFIPTVFLTADALQRRRARIRALAAAIERIRAGERDVTHFPTDVLPVDTASKMAVFVTTSGCIAASILGGSFAFVVVSTGLAILANALKLRVPGSGLIVTAGVVIATLAAIAVAAWIWRRLSKTIR